MTDLITHRMTLPTAGAVLVVLAALGYRLLKPKPLKGIPHNPITSILGDIPEITEILKKGDKTLYDYYEVLVGRHGPVTQLCVGNNSMLVLADPAEADRLVVKGKNVEATKFLGIIYSRLIPNAQISLPANDMWKLHRRMFGPMLSQEHLSRMVNHISIYAMGLVELWDAKLKLGEGKSFNAMVDIKLAVMDAIGHVTLGSSLGCVEGAQKSLSVPRSTSNQVVEFDGEATPPIYDAMIALFTHLGNAPMLPMISITFPIYTWLSRSWRSSKKLARGFIDQKIEGAKRRDSNEGDCILDTIIRREKEEGQKLTREELLDELLLMFIGGQDTTSATLFWFVKYMPSDPDIQQQLHDEVCSVFGDDMSGLTLDALKDSERVPVLEAVVAETLRCAMVGGAIGKYLAEDEVILGRHVPKGTGIIVATGLMGMDESAWGPDAKQWRPARWLRPDGSFDPHAGPSGHPFGLGKRSCFGERLAIVKLKVFISVLSRAFRFQPVPEQVGSMHAVAVVSRQPKQCYVSLDKWET
ncbi:cytochrome P450 family protein [Ceratobasidium sp. AG-Ba]|nr:cytochrome P450 family protein [Ceratobasidium sp. AG-Ba]